MSDKRFKIPAPPPMYAIRSCVADKAKTIDADRFLELETMVNQSATILDAAVTQLEGLEDNINTLQTSLTNLSTDLSTVRTDLETLNTTVTAQLNQTAQTLTNLTTNLETIYNEMITNFNTMAEALNSFTTVIEYICTLLFPTGTIVCSTKPPSEYIYFDKENGVWGNLPGNWGWCDTPITELTFTWNDPVDPTTVTEEPDTSTWEKTTDASVATEKGGNKIHTVTIPIYAYYCQKEEEADFGTITTLPTLPKITVGDLTTSNS